MNKAATWLIEKRKKEKLSLRELAHLTGLSHATISKAENGEASFETWKTLAEHFGTDTKLVLSWAEMMERETSDPWVTEMSAKLKLLNPELRSIAENVIEAIAKSEDRSEGKKK